MAALVGLAVVLIVAGAAGFRLAELSSQPGGLYPDEAAEGVTAHLILHQPGYHPLFISEDAGREPLYAYAVAGAFAVFGESTVTLRSVSAVIGVLGVLAVGLAARRFGTCVMLVAMTWAAGSLWLVSVSRDGMRNITVVVAAALAVAALFRWSDRPGRTSAWMTGAVIGLGLWTYQPLKFTPVLVVLWLWLLRRSNRPAFDALIADVRWCIGGFLIVAGPMIFVALTDPVNYLGRGASVSVLNVTANQDTFFTHVIKTFGQFTFVGDPNPRHDVNGASLLGWPLFALAVIGAIVAWRRRRDPPYLLLLLGVPVFLFPPLIATEGGSPHFLRNLGLAPFLACLIGLGALATLRWIADRGGARLYTLSALALAGALVAIGALNADAYFSRPVKDRYTAYSFATVALAAAADHGPHTAVIVDDYSVFDVQFLDSAQPPTVVAPRARIRDPHRYARIVAPSRGDLAAAVGRRLAARAVPSAPDPQGKPTVYTITL